MDWSALVGAISAAVVLAIGAAVKAALDMRKGQVEVRVAEQAAIRARRADAVAEWKALLDERDDRIDRLDVKVGQLEQEPAVWANLPRVRRGYRHGRRYAGLIAPADTRTGDGEQSPCVRSVT